MPQESGHFLRLCLLHDTIHISAWVDSPSNGEKKKKKSTPRNRWCFDHLIPKCWWVESEMFYIETIFFFFFFLRKYKMLLKIVLRAL